MGTVSLQHLQLLGRGYVIDHCIAFFRRKNDRFLFEVYITDALKAIADNTAKLPEKGTTMQRRYAEIVQEKNGTEVDTEKEQQTASEIISNIKDKLNKLGG